MTAYPSITDYVEAVQDPVRAFRKPELQRAEFVLDPTWHIPVPASGSAAVVFRATVAGRDQALRFFIREDVSEKRRYAALDRHFVTHGLGDCVARTTWVDDAIQVRGSWWPMVQMEWIEGETLDSHLRTLAGRHDVGALHTLASTWRERVHHVQTAEFAHGDLQHGNVLVEPSGRLRLVDFDGSWIAAFQGLEPPHEQGNPNYQHVRRTWGRWMDTFPALVIYTGLLALSRRPDAWRNNEGVLFTREDLVHPDGTPTWQLLAAIEDPEVEHAVTRLRRSCDRDWSPRGDLEDLLRPERVTATRRAEATPARPVFELSANPRKDFFRDAPAATSGQAATPTDAAAETTFTGVRGTGGPAGTAVPPPRPGGPTPPSGSGKAVNGSRKAGNGSEKSIAAAAGIALLLALVIGGIVGGGSGGGSGFAAGIFVAVITFLVALRLMRNRS